jgi:antitoxin (DNA-binding transcriptional repressor) of toxin-antitoxin stability system
MAQRIAAASARKNLASFIQRAKRGERIKLTRYDTTAAILIPKQDLETLEECEKRPQSFRRRR